MVNIPSATVANTATLATTGGTNAGVVLDVLFRNLATTAVNFEIIICPTGSAGTAGYNRVQIQVPASAGNNGSTTIASLAALAPQLFDMDLAGNRLITLESSESIYVSNVATLTGAIYLTVKQRNF